MAAWYGSKGTSGLAQAIVSAVPAHDLCIECHLGGGAVMKRKPAARRIICIGLSRRAADSFRCGYPVEIRRGCAHRFLSAFGLQGRGLVCCDPPYVQPTRRSERRCRCGYTDGDHVALPAVLKSLPCQVAVSGCPSALCDARLGGWRSLEVQVNNQPCAVTETLWFNFDPGRPHWRTCGGRNFTDRHRIKRKAANWGRRCRATPPGERLAAWPSRPGNVPGGAVRRRGPHPGRRGAQPGPGPPARGRRWHGAATNIVRSDHGESAV